MRSPWPTVIRWGVGAVVLVGGLGGFARMMEPAPNPTAVHRVVDLAPAPGDLDVAIGHDHIGADPSLPSTDVAEVCAAGEALAWTIDNDGFFPSIANRIAQLRDVVEAGSEEDLDDELLVAVIDTYEIAVLVQRQELEPTELSWALASLSDACGTTAVA